jgi:apolipoprotein N-acyltransferase
VTSALPRVLTLPRVPLVVGALVSSGLFSLALRPWGLGALALLALVPLVLVLARENSVWRGGFYTYLVMVGGVWVAIEGLALEYPWVFVVGVFIYALVFGLVGAVVVWCKNRLGTRAILAFPFAWVALEFAIGQPLLFGNWANPIMAIGYTQFDTPLLQAARWSGVSGVSFLVVATNTALAFLWLETNRSWRFLPLGVVVVLSGLALVPFDASTPKGSPFRVGIPQAHLPTLEYTLADFDAGAQSLIAERYKMLLKKLTEQKAQLVVLPETALGGWYSDLERNRLLRDTLSGVSLALVGAKTSYQIEGKPEGRNAILEYQREAGRLREVYAKQLPIPLTEAGFAKGKNVGLVRLGGVLFGLGICWENVFPHLSRASIQAGAEVLVYQNSLLWAGATATPVLHQRISAFRAVETGRMVIHATAGGSSAILDHTGQVLANAPQSFETILVTNVQPRVGITTFVKFGDWFGVFCCFLVLVVLFLSSRRRLGQWQNVQTPKQIG